MFFSLSKSFLSSSRFLKNVRLLSQKTTDLIFEKLAQNDAGIAVIGFNRAKAKNSFGLNLVTELEESLQSIKNDKDVRVVILRSHVPGIFCAGNLNFYYRYIISI